MIKSKTDLKEYLKADKYALNKDKQSHVRFLKDEIWQFEILLRKCEYFNNCRKDFIGKIWCKLLKCRFISKSIKLGFSIPLNVCGKGLSIAHYGYIVISKYSKIGEYCRIHEGVTIGVTGEAYWGNQEDKAPIIGDNVFIGTGAKIIGNISIANNVAIGANSVVCKSIIFESTTWAGVPAKKISDKNSEPYIRSSK